MSHTTSVKSVPIKSECALRAAVRRLQAAGIDCELLENAVPRMFYENQIGLHVKAAEEARSTGERMGLQFHGNAEECDFVLKLNDSFYDIGFLRDKNGHWQMFFDDYDYRTWRSTSGKCGIKGVLGAAFDGRTEHWSGQREAGEQQLHSVGKLLQAYSAEATIEAATAEGYSVLGEETDNEGNLHITIGV
jgi:hypothetical protein